MNEIIPPGGKRPLFRESIERRLLVERLGKMAPDEAIGADELKQLVGVPVDATYGPLRSAMNKVRDHHGMLVVWIRDGGIKRIKDADIPAYVAHNRAGRARRNARLAQAELACVQEFAALPQPVQNTHNALLSAFAVARAVTSTPARRKLEEAVDKARRELPMGETLKALGLAT